MEDEERYMFEARNVRIHTRKKLCVCVWYESKDNTLVCGYGIIRK